MSIKIGKLYLIPTTLGDNEPLEVLPISVKKVIEKVDHYIVENEKSARRFIKKISPRKSQPSLHIATYTNMASIHVSRGSQPVATTFALLSECELQIPCRGGHAKC